MTEEVSKVTCFLYGEEIGIMIERIRNEMKEMKEKGVEKYVEKFKDVAKLLVIKPEEAIKNELINDILYLADLFKNVEKRKCIPDKIVLDQIFDSLARLYNEINLFPEKDVPKKAVKELDNIEQILEAYGEELYSLKK